ncbi:hypothetical protein YPC_2242 [Yersinia pestis biovar Medievalis str. Harbin 35]|nr:hypothetical protein YPC_2242 [Yersinia pestis biovar Medievalis str. Harbin 35]EEO76988.1 hypothetical protein YP516_1720 [Yersinia pestis Nepal516]
MFQSATEQASVAVSIAKIRVDMPTSAGNKYVFTGRA